MHSISPIQPSFHKEINEGSHVQKQNEYREPQRGFSEATIVTASFIFLFTILMVEEPAAALVGFSFVGLFFLLGSIIYYSVVYSDEIILTISSLFRRSPVLEYIPPAPRVERRWYHVIYTPPSSPQPVYWTKERPAPARNHPVTHMYPTSRNSPATAIPKVKEENVHYGSGYSSTPVGVSPPQQENNNVHFGAATQTNYTPQRTNVHFGSRAPTS